MKKSLKILSLVLVFVLALAPVVTLAVPFEAEPTEVPGIEKFAGPVGSAITVIQWVGYAVAVIMILWLGVQWMIAQPAKKAELKGKMWSMAVGIVLLVAGVSILKVVWNMAESANIG